MYFDITFLPNEIIIPFTWVIDKKLQRRIQHANVEIGKP